MPPTCEVCKQQPHKYKCPKCLVKYCCVACFKKHKEDDVCQQREKMIISSSVPTAISTAPLTTANNELEEGELSDVEVEETEDTVPKEKLHMLGHSAEVLSMLENPHLRQILRNLDSSQNPEKDADIAMKEPIFTEFADACLNVVEPDIPLEK